MVCTTFMGRIRSRHAHNVLTLKSAPLAEISGSLGDLGTLLPLMIALAVNGSISLSTTLVFSGLWNILTGVVFGIPLPVQPMKAIAAVAISRKFNIEQTTSAGFTVAAAVFLFSITGSLRWFTRIIPVPVVKGIQVGAGLSLIISAGTTLLQPLGWNTPYTTDNLMWATLAFLALLLTQKLPRTPYALIIFILGIALSLPFPSPEARPHLQLWFPQFYIPNFDSFTTGALNAGLGQIPLTTLNSIIAVHYLSADLLPDITTPSVTAIGMSVALMNLIGGWFGAMPVCHGSGGLAAQYRFGARSGASVILLGIFKLLLGFMFGDELVYLLKAYPKGLLGVMVFAAGLELVKVGESLNHGARDLWEVSDDEIESKGPEEPPDAESSKQHRSLSDEERQERWMVMFMTVGGLLAFKNDGVGFIAGMLYHYACKSPSVVVLWRTWRVKRAARSDDTGEEARGEEEPLIPERENASSS